MKKLIFFFVVLAFMSVGASNVKFYNVNKMYGISMREANSVCEDQNGFIWGASKMGIVRLSGDDNYKIYQLPLETVNILSVDLVYTDAVFLAYTNNGQIFSYNPIADRFELLVNIGKVLNNSHMTVSDILVDNDSGALWITSSFGLYKYHKDKLELVSFAYENVFNEEWFSDREIVIAKSDGLYLFNINSLKSELLHPYNDFELEISRLFFDEHNNKLWIGTLSSGLYFYDFQDSLFQKMNMCSLPAQPVLDIESLSDSIMLIGIDGQGLWEVNTNTNDVANVYKEDIDNSFSLRGNGVYDIFLDSRERVWVATYSGGLSWFNLSSSSVVNHIKHVTNKKNSLVNNDVNCIIEDSKGKMWIGTNNGISCWDKTNDEWKHYYANNKEQAQVFLTLCEDDKGRIWAGTYSSGVYIIDGETGKQLEHYSESEVNTPFNNDFVFDIYKDSRGDLWIGGINREVIRYSSKNENYREYTVQPLYVFEQFSENEMLFGCTYGLSLSNNKTGEAKNILLGCLVMDLYVDDSIVWIATGGDGLLRFNPETGIVEEFTTSNGLPSNYVSSLTFSNGFLWLGTENGLCRFNPRTKRANTFSTFNALSKSSFNRNAGIKLKDGNLAWGTNNGVVIFDPSKIHESQSNGKIFLQNISISGRTIRQHKGFKLNKPLNKFNQIELKHHHNTIAFDFLPLGDVSEAKFSWKMESIDKDWTQPAKQHLVSYINLPSGENILRIRMYNSSISRIIDERVFKIVVTPPFWATPWFLVIVFIIISTIIYYVFWNYINVLKQRHSEEKARFFTNTAHDLRTSLTLIKAPIEELSNETNISPRGRNNIQIASEQALRLSSVISQLMDFQKIDIGKGQLSLSMTNIVAFVKNRVQMYESLAAGKGVTIKFNSAESECYTAIDKAMMEKVVDNLISNAVKYSCPDTEILISLTTSDESWSLEVRDYGIGISKKARHHLFNEFYRAENAVNSKIVGSGIGLVLVKSYVKAHGGEVSVSGRENEETVFWISVPVKHIESGTISLQSEQVKNDIAGNKKPVQAEINEDIAANQSKEYRLLIVEDNDELLYFMKSALTTDFEIDTAGDGDAAWQMIQKQLPDLVVSDVMMPNKDGFELCEQIKSTFETSHIPVVLLTALSGKTEKLQGLGLGADDYLTKPFDMELLRQKIKTIIKNRQSVREKALRIVKGTDNERIFSNELNDQFIKKMLDVVKENIAKSSFSKNEFASAMNVSSSLLYKKVKSLTSQSPTDFIKTVRLNHALELLHMREYSVTEVSEKCGFSSVGYFSTVFKKHFGKKPTEV
jgi:signal transduction histidine kinase/DNA-binding response OmpR family regulator/ligand-binding sensor domain-containing protein